MSNFKDRLDDILCQLIGEAYRRGIMQSNEGILLEKYEEKIMQLVWDECIKHEMDKEYEWYTTHAQAHGEHLHKLVVQCGGITNEPEY